MKVSVELDAEEVLEEAMKATGARSKEDAVYIALQSVSKADWLKDFSVVGPFPPPEEWKEALSSDYAPQAPFLGRSPSTQPPPIPASMKLRLLADSSFYIAALRARTDPFLRFRQHYPNHELVTCGMVMLEVLPGVNGPKLVEYIRKEFAQLPYVPTQASTWEAAQEISRDRPSHQKPRHHHRRLRTGSRSRNSYPRQRLPAD